MSTVELRIVVPAETVNDILMIASAAFAEEPFTDELMAVQKRLGAELTFGAVKYAVQNQVQAGG